MSYGFLSFKLELNPLWSNSLTVHRLNKKMLINSTPPYIHAGFSKIILFYKLFCTHITKGNLKINLLQQPKYKTNYNTNGKAKHTNN